MRKELELIEKIELYLQGKLTTIEKESFEALLTKDSDLQQKVAIQRNLIAGIEKLGLIRAAKTARKKHLFRKISSFIAIFLGVCGLAIAAFFYLGKKESTTFPPAENNKIEAPQTILIDASDSLYIESNDYLAQEIFEIQTDRDTVVESSGGMVLFIPANAFNTNATKVDFVLQEALTPATILYAGLSTKTETGEALETGGMFYLDAYVNGKRVNLTKDLTVDIPSDPGKTGMHLYDGMKDSLGEIVWKNPQPLSKPLKTVDITSLDFYPPGYEKQMNSWGYLNKSFIDSLYYSCEVNCEDQTIEIVSDEKYFIEGRDLFRKNCASCHRPNQDMTGPALIGARERWIKNSTEENFYAWIKNPHQVIASGDPYANRLFNRWKKTVMTSHKLTNSQIDQLFYYVESQNLAFEMEKNNPIAPTTINTTDSTAVSNGTNSRCGVKPSVVQTIWNEKFNSTNLATKEFEERMPWIHRSCNTAVLELYINNLDKNLYEVDEMAMRMVDGELKAKFRTFAALEQGKVELGSDAQKALLTYYADKQKILEKIAYLTNETYTRTQDSLNNLLKKQQLQATNRNNKNIDENQKKELAFNTEKVYAELGMPLPKPSNRAFMQMNPRNVLPANPSQQRFLNNNIAQTRAIVSNLGWKNVDCLLSVSMNRESVQIRGYNNKTASLSYSPVNITVSTLSDYSKTHAYIIPVKFNSYVKLNASNGSYTYNLNDALSYQIVVIGWKDDSFYAYFNESVTKGSATIILEKINLADWQNLIETKLKGVQGMTEEFNYLDYLRKDEERQNTQAAKSSLKNKILPFVFPCMTNNVYERAGPTL